ncbi:MAG: hypothetical protein WC966_00365 [Bradymonadales bacterium]|jgi:hypothetical protein
MYRLAIIFASLLTISCTRYYSLPDAPPKEEWQSHAIEESENPQEVTLRQLEAKRASIQVYSALLSKDWDKALSLMSAETVALFRSASPSEDPKLTLESGVLELRGQSIPFDPVADIFITNLSDIRTDFGEEVADSTKTRQILFAVDGNKRARKIAMIKEGGIWVLHSPMIKSPIIQE